MKKTIFIIVSITLLFFAFPPNSQALTTKNNDVVNTQKLTEKESAQLLLNRLDELKHLNKSDLTITEKKNLENEILKINNELKTIGDGIYLSIGTILIIVILLVILF